MVPILAGAVVVGLVAAGYYYRNSLTAAVKPAPLPKDNATTEESTGVNPAFQPRSSTASLIVSLDQDVFNEVSHLIQPIAEATVLEMKIEDHKTPMVKATDIKVTNFDIKDLIMDTEDGHLSVHIDDVAFKVGLNIKILAGKVRPTIVSALIDVSAKIDFYVDVQDKKIKTNVFDTKIALRDFDCDIHFSFAPGEALVSTAIDFVETILRKSIEETLDKTVTSSLQSGLDSVMARNWDIAGNVSRVNYNCGVEFLGNPSISKAEGVKFTIGIDIAHEIKASAEAAAAEAAADNAAAEAKAKAAAEAIAAATAAAA